jgi:hypothetical protein
MYDKGVKVAEVISRSKSGRYITFDINGELYILDAVSMRITTAWDGTFSLEAFNENYYELDIQALIGEA